MGVETRPHLGGALMSRPPPLKSALPSSPGSAFTPSILGSPASSRSPGIYVNMHPAEGSWKVWNRLLPPHPSRCKHPFCSYFVQLNASRAIIIALRGVSLMSPGYNKTSLDPSPPIRQCVEDPGAMNCRLLPSCGRHGNFALHFNPL